MLLHWILIILWEHYIIKRQSVLNRSTMYVHVHDCKLPWEWEHPLIYQRAEQSQTSQRLGLDSRWIDWGRSGIYQALWVLWCHPFWTKQKLSQVSWDLQVQTTASWYSGWSRSSWCHQQKMCKSEINGKQVFKMDGRNSESFPKIKLQFPTTGN